jgi:hypothetical protein
MGRPNVALKKVWRHLGIPDDSFVTDLFQFYDNILQGITLAFRAGIHDRNKQSLPQPRLAAGRLRRSFHAVSVLQHRQKQGICIFGRAQPFKMHDTAGNVATSHTPGRLQKTNHTGLHSEPKADCLGKSTSSSASR